MNNRKIQKTDKTCFHEAASRAYAGLVAGPPPGQPRSTPVNRVPEPKNLVGRFATVAPRLTNRGYSHPHSESGHYRKVECPRGCPKPFSSYATRPGEFPKGLNQGYNHPALQASADSRKVNSA